MCKTPKDIKPNEHVPELRELQKKNEEKLIKNLFKLIQVQI